MTTANSDKGIADRSMGFGLKALNRLAGSDLLDRIKHPQAGREDRLQDDQERLPHRDRRRAAPSRRPSSSANRRARRGASRAGLFDVSPDDEQQMFQEARPLLRRGEDPPGRARGRRRLLDPARAARPDRGARRQHARRPRGARRRHARAGRGDQRPDRRGARPRRPRHRLRGARPRRRRHRDRPLGQRRAGGDLPARLHRRGRPRRGARDPRAAAAVRPAEAGDQGPQGGRRLDPRRGQVAGRPRRRVRALPGRRRDRARARCCS